MGWVQGGFLRPEKKLWLDKVALEFINSFIQNVELESK